MKKVSPTQYESGQGSINWRYLPASNEFIWYSERDDWGHLYLYDATTGKLKNQITKGNLVVTRAAQSRRKNAHALFSGGRARNRDATRISAIFTASDFDGKNLKLLTPEDGNHKIALSPSGRYFVDNYSKQDAPPVTRSARRGRQTHR